MSDGKVVYALVKVSKNRWIVARESLVIKGEFRFITSPLHESLARRIYDECRIMGEDRLSSDLQSFVV